MIIKTITRGQAQEAMSQWVNDFPNLPVIDGDFQQLRCDLQAINEAVRKEMANIPDIKKEDYYLDYRFGLLLYDYLNKQQGFSLRVASNDGFWRFLSVMIVPDVVSQRWGKDNDSHFWSQPSRNWFRSLWWYVHLSWQGDIDTTNRLLSSSHFSTDTILNFEERTGRKGTYVDVYRQIIKLYGLVPEKVLKEKGRGKNSDDLFRIVMKLNTAKLMVMDPALCVDGEEGYARSLFKDAGVDLDAS